MRARITDPTRNIRARRPLKHAPNCVIWRLDAYQADRMNGASLAAPDQDLAQNSDSVLIKPPIVRVVDQRPVVRLKPSDQRARIKGLDERRGQHPLQFPKRSRPTAFGVLE